MIPLKGVLSLISYLLSLISKRAEGGGAFFMSSFDTSARSFDSWVEQTCFRGQSGVARSAIARPFTTPRSAVASAAEGEITSEQCVKHTRVPRETYRLDQALLVLVLALADAEHRLQPVLEHLLHLRENTCVINKQQKNTCQ